MNQEIEPGPSQALRPLSKDPATEGFDLSTGETWIYPTNYSTREYQFNIIQKALLKNTLVSLPTGLGKTFIAAVVMYNFYRWYPEGKMIFMAPTKPLVKQQVDACYNIMAIPSEVTAELTGAKQSSARTDIWTDKRVFFITPQVLQNDLNRIEQLGPKIKCLVFDEAHKARGNHAYCQVIQRLLAQGHKNFRVLALSATPGSNVHDVLEIVNNLLISHLEFRTEESKDVQPYVFQRTLETVVVPLSDKLIEVRENYLNILAYYTKSLKNYNIIQGNCCSLTKGKIFLLMKDFQQKAKGTGTAHYGEIMKSLNICVTLYHAYELLIRHGLRNFLSFFEEHIEKPLLRGNNSLRGIVEDVRQFLGPIPNIEKLPDGTYPEVPDDINFGHPKYYKLRDVLMDHFKKSDENTRVIVFFEYRESVMEAHLLLLQSRPLIQPRIFLGQGSGITQKIQIGVVKAFREGKCNVLLSTCIGEEGLDVGEVDLIVCFDVSTKSPIRMVQRMGRTGRKRAGKVLVLVTEGKEQETLKDCLIQKNNISTFVLGSKQLSTGMYRDSPRLVPEDIQPRCEKIFITVQKKKLVLKRNGSIKDMLASVSSTSSELIFSQEFSLSEKPERIKTGKMLFNKVTTIDTTAYQKSILSKHIEKQRKLQKSYKIKHSKQSEALVKLLQFSDSKRFNLPTQVQTTQAAAKVLKQGDIRNMFLTAKSQDHFEVSKPRIDISTQDLVKNIENLEEDSQSKGFDALKEFFAQISNFIFLKTANNDKKCRLCPDNFYCKNFHMSLEASDILNNNWVPSDKIFETITLEDIESFSKTLDPKNEETIVMDNDSIFEDIDFTQLENEKMLIENEASFKFQEPDSLCQILDKFSNSILEDADFTQNNIKVTKTDSEITKVVSEEELAKFFKLPSLSDIFQNNTILSSSQETVVYSPDVTDIKNSSQNLKTPEKLIGTPDKLNNSNTENSVFVEDNLPSPVLSSENRIKMLRQKISQKNKKTDIQKDLFNSGSDPKLAKASSTPNQDKVYRSISPDLTRISQERAKRKHENTLETDNLMDVDDICDISNFFGVAPNENNHEISKQAKDPTQHIKKKNSERSRIIPLNELVDESLLDLLTPPTNKNDESINNLKTEELNTKINAEPNCNSSDDMFGDLVEDSFVNSLSRANNLKNAESKKHSDNIEHTSQPNTNQLQKRENEIGLENLIDDSFLNLLTQGQEFKTLEDEATSNNKEKQEEDPFYNLITQPNKSIKECQLFTPECTKNLKQKNNYKSNTDNLDIDRTPNKITNESKPKESDRVNLTNQKTTKDDERNSSDEFLEDTPMSFRRINKSKSSDKSTQKESSVVEKNNKDNNRLDFKETWLETQTENKLTSTDRENAKNKMEDITFVDLTLDSPIKLTPTKRPSNQTQLGITQMLSLINKTQANHLRKSAVNSCNLFGSQITQQKYEPLFMSTQKLREPLGITTQKKTTGDTSSSSSNNSINKTEFSEAANSEVKTKTSQKENEKNMMNNTSTSSEQTTGNSLNESSFVNTNWKSKRSKSLSTRKRVMDDTETDFVPPKTRPSKPELDPYAFITVRKESSKDLIKNYSKLDSSIEIFSSDDEFDTKPKKSPVLLKIKGSNVPNRDERRTETKDKKKKTKNKAKNPFLDVEAELSEDDNVFVSSDETDSDPCSIDDSFVVPNMTQNLDSQMHAHYLKSVRSPAVTAGIFKIPQRPTHNVANVFSQPINNTEENTYLEDSFCVDTNESQLGPEHELSELEILEMKLKNRKKKRKKSEENTIFPKSKRRRIIVLESDESD